MVAQDDFATVFSDAFREEDHPRNESGEFSSGGGGGGSKAKSASGSTDLGSFDATDGTLDGDTQLISSQTYRDPDIVQEKIDTGDFDVYVSPEFEANGEKMRVVLDGHHSLEAALESGNTPNFIEQTVRDNDNIATLEAGDVDGFLEQVHQGDDYHNPITGRGVF